MPFDAADLPAYGFTLAALVYSAFAAVLLRRGYAGQAHEGRRGARLFLAAVVASAAWGWAEACSRWFTLLPQVALAADWLRQAAWFAFLLGLLAPAPGRWPRLAPLAAGLIVLAGLAYGHSAWLGQTPTRAATAAAMGLAVMGLILVEQLFRNLAEPSRWNAKPVCLGLLVVFGFDLYLFSEALLFGRFDTDAAGIRGAIHALAVPLLFVASRRHRNWLGKLHVSRTAAFYSATLLLAGAYLLLISALGYYVRFFGGDWGRALQLTVLVSALVGLGALALSGSLRARLRVFVGKHFFSLRYDYRREWLRFTAMLSAGSTPQDLQHGVIRGLADMMESNGGSLWLRTADGREHRQAARWNAPEQRQAEPGGSALSAFLLDTGWIVDVAECRRAPQRYRGLELPAWLRDDPQAWLVVPLVAGEALIGFVVLVPPRTPVELNWEATDLLKTAARQAAGFLARMLATEALLEARKFEAFNKMSAFVVHDLKNIVTQLSLMLKNAKRLHDNPEFQQDMLLTVESSLDKMRQLMLQLREGAAPAGGAAGVDLAAIARRIEGVAQRRGRVLEVEVVDTVSTRGHEERIERVLGHLVANALDATPAEGRVWLRLDREAGRARVQVGDTGSGMAEDFVRNRLGKPFHSTKSGGMGIGAFESFQYVRELGGSIDVDSAPGRGTLVTVRLPLLEAGTASVLQPPAAVG